MSDHLRTSLEADDEGHLADHEQIHTHLAGLEPGESVKDTIDNATDGLVDKAGDTMTGTLGINHADALHVIHDVAGIPIAVIRRGSNQSDRRWAEFRAINDSGSVGTGGRINVYSDDDGGGAPGSVLIRASSTGSVRIWQSSLDVDNDLDVGGTKNARIADPDDGTKAYRFAAMEADEPGLLVKRLRNVEVDSSREARVAVPEQFARIGRDPMVFATYAAEPEGSSPHGPWAFVEGWDTGSPEVVLRAPQGHYHLLLTFCRDDAGVDGWEHVVTVNPAEDA